MTRKIYGRFRDTGHSVSLDTGCVQLVGEKIIMNGMLMISVFWYGNYTSDLKKIFF